MIYEDNTAALKWCYNPVNHAKQKHIPVAYNFIREQVAQFNTINVVPIATQHQLADLFTKCVPSPRLRLLIDMIQGLHPAPPSLPSPTNSKVAETVDKVTQAVESLKITLKDRLKSMPAPSLNQFFMQHFEEPDPTALQAKGLRGAAAAV